jgi:hypothetical protein
MFTVVIPTADPPTGKDPQSAIEPASDPGSGQKYLARFGGTWDVVKTFHPASGEPVRASGECRQELIHDGRFLRSEFNFTTGAGKTTGTGLIGFDPASGLFTSVWVDSRSTRMSMRQSREKFNGREIALHSAGLEGGLDARPSRTSTRLEAGDTRIVHRQFGTGLDGKERLVMELVMTRKTDRR